MNNEVIDLTGQSKLDDFFGLSYASWLTLPRVFLNDIPDEWKKQFTELLEQLEDRYPNAPNMSNRVMLVDASGKFRKTPKELINYRRPDRDFLKRCRA